MQKEIQEFYRLELSFKNFLTNLPRELINAILANPSSTNSKDGVQTQGQGHETTFAQIIAEELGFPEKDVLIEHGDTDTAPYGRASHSTSGEPG